MQAALQLGSRIRRFIKENFPNNNQDESVWVQTAGASRLVKALKTGVNAEILLAMRFFSLRFWFRWDFGRRRNRRGD